MLYVSYFYIHWHFYVDNKMQENVVQLWLVSSFLCYVFSHILETKHFRTTHMWRIWWCVYKLHTHVPLFFKVWAHPNLVGILLASQKILHYLISIHVKQETVSFSFYSEAISNAKWIWGKLTFTQNYYSIKVLFSSYDDFICQSSFNA